MDVSSISNAATSLSAMQATTAVQMTVLKKALDAEAQSAAQLINALPQPASLPDHLGQRVNTVA